jgi:hypothetical protein
MKYFIVAFLLSISFCYGQQFDGFDNYNLWNNFGNNEDSTITPAYHSGDHHIIVFKTNDDSIAMRKRLTYKSDSEFYVIWEANKDGVWESIDSTNGSAITHTMTTQTVTLDTYNVAINFALNDTVFFREILADRTDHYTDLFQFDSLGTAVNADSLELSTLSGSIGTLTTYTDTVDTYLYMYAEGVQVYRERFAKVSNVLKMYYEFKNSSGGWAAVDSLIGPDLTPVTVDTDSLIYAFTRFDMTVLGLSGFQSMGGTEVLAEDSIESVADNVYYSLGGTSAFGWIGDSVYNSAQAQSNEALDFGYVPDVQSNRGAIIWFPNTAGFLDGTCAIEMVIKLDSIPATDRYIYTSENQGQFLVIKSDSMLNFGYRITAGTYTNIVSTSHVHTDTWYHIVICRNSGADESKLYINGELDKTGTQASGLYAGTNMIIGSNTTVGGTPPAMLMRYILFYSVNKTDATTRYNNAVSEGWIP